MKANIGLQRIQTLLACPSRYVASSQWQADATIVDAADLVADSSALPET